MIVALLLATFILVLDLSMPLGVAGGVPYVALVLMGWWFPIRGSIFILAAASSILTVIGYFYSPDGGIPWVVFTNRAYALFAIWTTAFALWTARRSRAQVMQNQERLKHSMKMAEAANIAKSEFLATVSHELRTPLNAINGFSDAMQKELFGPISNDKYREYIQFIQQSGNHLKGLVVNLLDVSAIEAGKLELNEEEIDTRKIIEHSVRTVSPRSELRDVSIHVSLPDHLPALYADRQRVHEIQLNILSNAIKFSPEGGEVSLVADVDDDGWMAVSVSDNGVGMDEKELQKAVENFGRTDSTYTRKFEGVGLGLPLSKALMKLHDGTLDIVSAKGTGTTVTLKFPKERFVQNSQ